LSRSKENEGKRIRLIQIYLDCEASGIKITLRVDKPSDRLMKEITEKP
jgi:hypothetical protein